MAITNMGSYAELTIANFPILYSKSEVIPEVMTIFRESDRKVYFRSPSCTNQANTESSETDLEQDELNKVVEYSCETGKVAQRLDVMGFTLARVDAEFEAYRSQELERFEEYMKDPSYSGLDEYHQDTFALLKMMSFGKYIEALQFVFSNDIRAKSYFMTPEELSALDPVVQHIISEENVNFGIFSTDSRYLIRVICELCDPKSFVTQDISDLIYSGYYSDDEPVCDKNIQMLISGHLENAPRIILTEGSSDANILREALDFLFPHLSGYYTFLDFESTRAPGGASELVKQIKAFAAAGVTNRLIAIFDNDTAAFEAIIALNNISLPSNVAILHYPEIENLNNYPTYGPNGLTSMNVNGLAGSIELYLGNDVLQDKQGILLPIQWKGYNEKLERYHGEVTLKAEIQKRFIKKIKLAKDNPEEALQLDWSGLKAILQTIFHAFD